MKPEQISIGLFVWILAVTSISAASPPPEIQSPIHLRCEYRVDPKGIGETKPRLGWQFDADPQARGVRQSAYRILVASTPQWLAKNKGDLWDSGKIDSDAAQQIVYAGKRLQSREQCWWKIRAWDENGRESEWSKPGYWSIGLLQTNDWQAKWIGFDTPTPTKATELSDAARSRLQKQKWAYAGLEPSKTQPLTAYVRGEWKLPPDKKLIRAAIALSPDQICTITANGKPIGDVTRWEQMHLADLTSALISGTNVIGLKITQYDGYRPAALGEIELQFADGSKSVEPIDASWKFATNAPAGWDLKSFDDSDWLPMLVDGQPRTPWSGPPETFTYHLSPAPFLRKTFVISKPVRRATIYSTALGIYELHLNGARVGSDYFAPGWTDFHSRVQYQTYDVTKSIDEGTNALGAILGDGWYASVLSYTGQRYFYGGYPRLLAQLEIEYADGTRETIVTDKSWRAATGPIRSADLMAGCVYDARLQMDNWAKAKFEASNWQPVATGLRTVDSKKPLSPFVIEAANADASRITGELPALSVTEPRPGAWTFDLGQNIAGWVRLKVRGHAGQKIMVRYGEMLNPNGTLYTSNLRGANATDIYYLRGDGTEMLEPYFTFHGFRYVEITGLDENPGTNAVTGIVVGSPLERTGEFTCSSPLVNQLARNILWSQRDNFLEVPTDCPQRDERAGWTGDAQFFIGTAAYNADVAAFFTRWLTTLAQDSQLPSGAMANVAPKFGSPWAGTGWGGDAAIRCIYTIYHVYGDTRIIQRNYDALDRYMNWEKEGRPGGDVAVRPIGDHLNLGGGASVDVIQRAYFANLSALMAEMAKAIGRTNDATRYRAQSEEAKLSFQRDCILSDGSITNSGQTGYALAFTMDLVPDKLKTKVADKFVAGLKKDDWHLATGFIGTPRLLPGLHLAGRDDIAYRLLLQETYPSWLFPIKNGATTMWERWDGWTPEKGFQTISMNSFNHYSFGAVGEYLYGEIAGINSDGPGYHKIVIRPVVGAGLTNAQAIFDSPSGRIESGWRIDGDQLYLKATIPPNTIATIYIPSKSTQDVIESGKLAAQSRGVKFIRSENGESVFAIGSGKYRFESQLP
ncbi:MAG TPA: family 78 glycoside hydrolase catalytic domain [Verrucomicrobiae bacterium]|nr:family 78 glycoside hydrolase catalytic domain [Verrucomicrobiae bacterium]